MPTPEVKYGTPAQHYKSQGAACTVQTISECILSFQCKGGVCGEVPSGAQATPQSSTGAAPTWGGGADSILKQKAVKEGRNGGDSFGSSPY